MGRAQERALAVRKRFRIIGTVDSDDLARVLSHYRLRVVEFPFLGRVREVLYDRAIGVRTGLDAAEKRWLQGHALGHFFLHRGNHLSLDECRTVPRQEHQAEVFAGWFFLGQSWLGMEAWEIAETYGLPQDRVDRWLQLHMGEVAVSATW